MFALPPPPKKEPNPPMLPKPPKSFPWLPELAAPVPVPDEPLPAPPPQLDCCAAPGMAMLTPHAGTPLSAMTAKLVDPGCASHPNLPRKVLGGWEEFE